MNNLFKFNAVRFPRNPEEPLKHHYLIDWRADNARGWQATIKEQRHKIQKLLKRNPSLKPHLQTLFAEEDIYQDAYLRAIAETNLPFETFPEQCPYSLEQIIAIDFFPL